MDPTLTALVAFGLTLGGAFFGIALGKILPKQHTDGDTRDVIKVSIAVVATLAALVSGLLISSAKSSFDSKDSELRRGAARLVMLDRTLAEYGEETRIARIQLRETLQRSVDNVWGSGSDKIDVNAIDRTAGMMPMRRFLLDLKPTNESQAWIRNNALQLTVELDDLRLKLIEQKDGSVRWQFVAILILWFTIIFFSFGLFAPRNGVAYAILTASSLCVTAAIYLILQMDRPYGGLIKISPDPLLSAISQMGQ